MPPMNIASYVDAYFTEASAVNRRYLAVVSPVFKVCILLATAPSEYAFAQPGCTIIAGLYLNGCWITTKTWIPQSSWQIIINGSESDLLIEIDRYPLRHLCGDITGPVSVQVIIVQ